MMFHQLVLMIYLTASDGVVSITHTSEKNNTMIAFHLKSNF